MNLDTGYYPASSTQVDFIYSLLWTYLLFLFGNIDEYKRKDQKPG